MNKIVLTYNPNCVNESKPFVSNEMEYKPFNCKTLAMIKANNPTNAIRVCVFSLSKIQEANIINTPNKAEAIIAFIINSFNYLINNCCKVSAVKSNKGAGYTPVIITTINNTININCAGLLGTCILVIFSLTSP